MSYCLLEERCDLKISPNQEKDKILIVVVAIADGEAYISDVGNQSGSQVGAADVGSRVGLKPPPVHMVHM
jgi:hypothetical protein